jgi:dinuclear metal center YbgI/SA1388 family protein
MSFRVRHISKFLESWAPLELKLDYDNVGLLLGDPNAEVRGIISCLDVTEQVLDECLELNCNLIVAHHPIIFRPLSRITSETKQGELIRALIKNDINAYASHTNLDSVTEGVSFQLAYKIGLQNVQILEGDDVPNSGLGAIGDLPNPVDTDTFLRHVSESLNLDGIRYSGNTETISRVAVCGGAGSSLQREARQQNADAFVTSDIKYHEYFEEHDPLLLLDVGHYESEIMIVEALSERLHKEFPNVLCFTSKVNTNPMKLYLPTLNTQP